MKKWIKGIAPILIVIAAAATGFSQEEIIVMESPELAPHTRPLVSFKHEMHAADIGCVRCHHDPDPFGYNLGAEGARCADCHQAGSGDNPVPLRTAVHRQCKGCHMTLAARNVKEGLPMMCGQCHRIDPGAAN